MTIAVDLVRKATKQTKMKAVVRLQVGPGLFEPSLLTYEISGWLRLDVHVFSFGLAWCVDRTAV